MIAGLTAAKLGFAAPTNWLLGGAFGLALGAAVLAGRLPFTSSALLLSAMFLAGAGSYQLHRPEMGAWGHLPPREARMTVSIERGFEKSDRTQFSALGTIQDAPAYRELIGQRVYVSAVLSKSERGPLRSEVVVVAGVLAAVPWAPAADTFEGYLANAGVNFRLTRALIVSHERAPSAYSRFRAAAAARFARILGEGVQEKRPHLVGVYRALMLGRKTELTPEQATVFRESGTMHVFTISGLHIGVIALTLQGLLSLSRMPTPAKFVLGLSALWFYVDITGLVPSAVRAFSTVALIEVAWVFRVPRNAISALVTSALIVVLVDPLEVFGAGFEMSYGIVSALLLLGLPLDACWQKTLKLHRHLPPATWTRRQKAADWLWRRLVTAAAISCAASLVGAITGLTFFKLFSPGALLINLWLIPSAMGVLMMGLVSLLCGLAGFTGGSLLANHGAVLLLWGIEAGVRQFAHLPGVWFAATFKYPWIGVVALVVLLAAIGYGYAAHWRGWNRGFWAPFAIVGLVFCFGVTFL
jgi:competence protein ComEC